MGAITVQQPQMWLTTCIWHLCHFSGTNQIICDVISESTRVWCSLVRVIMYVNVCTKYTAVYGHSFA